MSTNKPIATHIATDISRRTTEKRRTKRRQISPERTSLNDDETTQRQDVPRRLVEPGAPKTAYLNVRGARGIPARNHLESFQCVYFRIQIARSHPSIQDFGQSWANSWKPGSHACSSLRSRGGRPPLPGKRFIAISRCKEH